MNKKQIKALFKDAESTSRKVIHKVHGYSTCLYKVYLRQIHNLVPKAEIGKYIESHCRIYNDDGPDDPSLTPSGKHISYPVKNIRIFKKYFKIVPKSEIGIVVKNNKKGRSN